MDVIKKDRRGGYREGAGRKKKDNRTQTVAFSISPELMQRIAKEALMRGVSRSKLIVDAIEDYLK